MSNDACSHSNSLDEPINMLVKAMSREERRLTWVTEHTLNTEPVA
jgi:hypothetical protein